MMKAVNMTRRRVVQALGMGGLALSLPLPFGLLAQSNGLQRTSLSDTITLISGAGCNVVVAEGPDGVVVIDGGGRESAEALLAEINSITGNKPVKALFNTNWRPEHTGLNYLLGSEGIEIIAQENTRLWQTGDFTVDWEDKRYEPMPVEAQANSSFYRMGSMTIGDETLEYRYHPQAHTDGDISLYFKNADILVTSDLLAVVGYPVMDWETGGWVGGFQNATRDLLEIAGDNTRIIPAEGPVSTRADLQAQAELLDKAREQVALAYQNGMSLEGFQAQNPIEKIGSGRPGAELFINQLYHGAWGHERELGKIV